MIEEIMEWFPIWCNGSIPNMRFNGRRSWLKNILYNNFRNEFRLIR